MDTITSNASTDQIIPTVKYDWQLYCYTEMFVDEMRLILIEKPTATHTQYVNKKRAK